MTQPEPLEPRRLLAAVVLREQVTDFGASEFADDVTVQRDDRIVVLGHTENAPGGDRLFIARYDIDGSLDPFFGENGRIFGEFAQFPRATSLAIDRSGRIIVAGVTSEANPRIAVMRFTRSGFLDTTFGNGGLATLDAGSGEAVNDVAVDSSGRVTIAGQALVSTTTTTVSAVMAARFEAIGQPDLSFGSGNDFGVGDGVTVIPVGVGDSAATSVVLDDGRIILGGFATEQEAGQPAERRFALLRLESFGNLDDDFGDGDDGIVVTDFGLPSSITDIARAKSGRIVAIGNTQPTDATVGEQILIARYERGGTLDPTFGGGDGFAISAFGGARSNLAREAVVDNKDRVLLAGEISDAGEPTGDLNDDQFLLARYLADGTPDASFGPEGAIIDEVRQGLDTVEQVAGVALQRDGKDGRVIVAGNTGTSAADQDVAIVRYATDATQGTGSVVLKSNGRRLVVKGTDRADVITVAPNVSANTIEVTINGVLTSVPAGGITRVTVGCRDGDDEASSSLGSEIITTLRGEDDDDDLRLFGDAKGRLEGGNDDDDLEGGRFADRLRGGRGEDVLFGGDGDDDIEGDSGFDRLFGEDGDDDLKADDGFADDVDGGSGDDQADVDLFDFVTRVDDIDFD